MKLRQHRGSLLDSLNTSVDIEPTMQALVDEIRKSSSVGLDVTRHSLSIKFLSSITKEDLIVEPYAHVKIGGEDCFLVTIRDYGVYGYTNIQPKE